MTSFNLRLAPELAQAVKVKSEEEMELSVLLTILEANLEKLFAQAST